MIVDFQTAYSDKELVSIKCDAPTKTQQHFKDQCDINRIVGKFLKTGVIDHVSKMQGSFADVESIDYRTSLEKVMQAQESFARLPSKVRARFQNDPSELFSFLGNEKNRKEAIELGLVEPLKVDAVVSDGKPLKNEGTINAS